MIAITDITQTLPLVRFIGNENARLNTVEELRNFSNSATSLTWCNDKNLTRLQDISHGTIICSPQLLEMDLQPACNYIVVEKPRQAFQQVVTDFFLKTPKTNFIAPSAAIDPSAKIGQNVFIGHHVVLEEGVVVGDNTRIGHNSVIHADTVIANDVIIGANTTIGGIGFGYEKDENGQYAVLPHIGNVVIKTKVEIGDNCAIDRAVIGSTILRENAKIGNLVHISHGVVVGKNSLVIANAMIGGSVIIGDNVWVAPSADILNGIQIGDDALIGMGAVVTKSVGEKAVMVGNPARSIRKQE
ncbi:UDP-3-O-(3-hydroxymyristoyl)glucosamine N-acyltransferase [Tellurirhabdus bombi]|uniref:UDP-3-O-(3-hydroxymyristoyl)glucosamine N-acyltransferase n=1 Tax=Tellurirhabdus bombi TaxID=2907205 RepID=UPI001F2616AF|nr:UDP-3-O-(3-hydroxymyristoyl)glucosamine N-acyltransferase [Tellurirhabdus bombi]